MQSYTAVYQDELDRNGVVHYALVQSTVNDWIESVAVNDQAGDMCEKADVVAMESGRRTVQNLLGLFVLLVMCSCADCKPPHIVFIVADDLGEFFRCRFPRPQRQTNKKQQQPNPPNNTEIQHTHTHTHTHTRTRTHTHTHTHTELEREKEAHTHKHTHTQSKRERGGERDRQTETDRQTQTERERSSRLLMDPGKYSRALNINEIFLV